MAKRGSKKAPNTMADKALSLILKGSKIGPAMRTAGYSEAYVKSCTSWVNSDYVQEELGRFYKDLETERGKALSDMPDKRSDASYAELMTVVEKSTRILQLLKGKPTDIDGITLLGDQIKALAEEK
jgi:hypothetical protein